MAKKKTVISKQSKNTSAGNKPVEIYEHKGTKRLNNPQVGLVNIKTEQAEKRKIYSYDPHLDPVLNWSGKLERTSFEVPTVSLHVHEKIDPRTVIEAIKKSPEKIWEQLNLFNRPVNKLNFIKDIEFYKHQKDWSNRLIAGDSLLVMNSLIEKEGMAGKVQVVYFDPPYGIKYQSNFQPFVNNRDVKDGKDADLTAEPETIRAFRDTWELGIHSFLSYLRDRILLSKELLHESGSIFVQIGDENAHHVREVLDEILGKENFVSMIAFVKGSGLASNTMPNVVDYIIWYAKDKSKMKYHQLYNNKTSDDGGGRYRNVMKKDGSIRVATEDEIRDPRILPEGEKLLTFGDLTKPGPGSRFNIEFDGESYRPEPRWWGTTAEGFKRLIKAKRIVKTGKGISYIRFLSDSPVFPITNCWDDIGGIMSRSDPKIYVVQTSTSAVERCLLMASDPGDLVIDPTCGSGTTAVVAEKWGRRWITCDTSRVAITLAKSRLLTFTFDYFQLRSEEEGVASGFIYNSVPKITIASIANLAEIDTARSISEINHYIESKSPQIDLVNSPKIETSKIRLTGPFTVEAVPAPTVAPVESVDTPGPANLNGPNDWTRELGSTGIRLKNGQRLSFSRLEVMTATRWLHAEGETDEKIPQRVVISFGPDFAPLEQKQIELALQEAEKIKPSPTVIVFAAFQFDPEAAKDLDEITWGGVTILKVQMNSDLFTEDLKKKKSSSESYWLIGQPDVSVNKLSSGNASGKYQAIVNGFDYYNPISGKMESGSAQQIAVWMLDTDYDGRSILPRQIFFPMAGPNDGWARLAKTLKNEIDEDLIEAYRGVKSIPFELGEHKRVAIKIIDDRGIESLIVQEIAT